MRNLSVKVSNAQGNEQSGTFTKSAAVKDHRGVNLIFDALPFGRLWDGEPDAISNASGCAKFIQLLGSRCAFPSCCPRNRGVCGNEASLTVF